MGLVLLTESFSVDISNLKITEAITEALKSSEKGMFLTLPVCKLGKPTLNDRTYTAEGMAKSIKEASKDMKARRLTCSADDHPATVNVAPIKASHLVTEAWVDGDTLWNKWEILGTDNGRNLKALIEGRVSIGTSIRGLGRVDENKVIQDYKFLGCDCVGTPAAGTYALAGSDGVKVEVIESVWDESVHLESQPPDHIHNTLVKEGYGDAVVTINSKDYPDDAIKSKSIEHLRAHGIQASMSAGGDRLVIVAGHDKDKAQKLLDQLHKESGSKINVKGAGLIGNNSIIEFRGITWRVANISGDSNQWCMSLMNDSGGPPAYIYSFDVQPNESIKIIKESFKESSMNPKVQFWMGQVTEAVATLESLRKGGNNREAIKHIARVDTRLAESDLNGEELKKVNEAWTEGKKAHPDTKVDETPSLVAQVESLTSLVSKLVEKAEASTPKPAPKVEKQLSEDDLSAIIRAKYKLDELQIKFIWSSFKLYKGDAIKFGESCNLITKSRVNSVELYSDMLTGTGDTKAALESFVNVHTLYSALEKVASNLFESIEKGKLIKAEVVQASFTESLGHVRQALQVISVRESIARELAVESQFKFVQLAEQVQEIIKDLKSLNQAQSRVIEAVRKELRQGGSGRVQVESQTADIHSSPLVENNLGCIDWI